MRGSDIRLHTPYSRSRRGKFPFCYCFTWIVVKPSGPVVRGPQPHAHVAEGVPPGGRPDW
jgi:hypothetical protein